MDNKERKRSVKSGKKLSAYFDRELSDRELSEGDKLFRHMREKAQGLRIDKKDMELYGSLRTQFPRGGADLLAGDSASGEFADLEILEEWREIRTSLREWHAEEMRSYDRERVGARLWSSISEELARGLDCEQSSNFAPWKKVFWADRIGSWFPDIFTAFRPRSLVGGLAVAAVALMLLPPFLVQNRDTPMGSVSNKNLRAQNEVQVGATLGGTSSEPQRFASIGASPELSPSPSEMNFSERKYESRSPRPDLVLGVGGVVRPGASWQNDNSPLSRDIGSIRGGPLTEVVVSRNRGSMSPELTAVGGLGLFSGGANGERSKDKEVSIEEFGARVEPSIAEDGMDWEWMRARGSVILIRSENPGEPPMVWVAANR